MSWSCYLILEVETIKIPLALMSGAKTKKPVDPNPGLQKNPLVAAFAKTGSPKRDYEAKLVPDLSDQPKILLELPDFDEEIPYDVCGI